MGGNRDKAERQREGHTHTQREGETERKLSPTDILRVIEGPASTKRGPNGNVILKRRLKNKKGTSENEKDSVRKKKFTKRQ